MKKLLSIALLTGSLIFSGCGSSENFVFTNNNPVQVAPVCQDDAYTTTQNQALSVNAANGVLANDEPNGGTLTFSATSAQGGTIAGNADGSFVYTPAADFNGPDSFTYVVANNAGQVTCTVNITVISTNGFFVDSVNGSDATGSFTNGIPYQTIQAAVDDAPTGADIIVRPGNYGTATLKDGQRLLGSGSNLVNAQGDVRPQLTGPVVMADGNTLDFLRIDGTNGTAAECDDQNGGTVTNCEFANTTNTGAGVGGLSISGTWTIANNTFTELGGTGIFLTSTLNDEATVIISNNTMMNNDLAAVVLSPEGDSDIVASVVNNVARNNNLVLGDAFEFVVEGTSTLCLDLENNVNDADNDVNNSDDGIYLFSRSDTGTEFNIEELIIGPPASVPTNTGLFQIDSDPGFSDPTPVIDGFCGF